MFPISLYTTFAKKNRKKLINMIADFIKKLQQKKGNSQAHKKCRNPTRNRKQAAAQTKRIVL